MKFNLNNQDKNQLEKLIKTKYLNLQISEDISYFISNHLYERNQVESLHHMQLNQLENQLKDDFFEFIDVNKTDLGYKDIEFKLLKPFPFLANPYYKTIQLDNIDSFNFKFFVDYYRPYELFIYKDTTSSNKKYYLEENHLGFFVKNFKFLELQQNSIPWMSLTPNEIITMEDSLNKVEGNVMTFGLGLGYFTFMALLNNKVKKVYVVEKDKKLIDLFNRHLFNQFINTDKLKIINADANEVITNPKYNLKNIDYLFIDTYHNANDGLEMYVNCLNKSKLYSNTKFIFWIENSLLCLFRRLIITLMEEEYYKYDVNYLTGISYIDLLSNKLHNYLLDKQFNSYREIDEFISNSSLINLIKTFE